MKKIVAAWIEQILEFPTKLEYLAYIESLKKGKPQKFKETSFEQLESGVVASGEMGMSYQYVRNLHKKALTRFEETYDNLHYLT